MMLETARTALKSDLKEHEHIINSKSELKKHDFFTEQKPTLEEKLVYNVCM